MRIMSVWRFTASGTLGQRRIVRRTSAGHRASARSKRRVTWRPPLVSAVEAVVSAWVSAMGRGRAALGVIRRVAALSSASCGAGSFEGLYNIALEPSANAHHSWVHCGGASAAAQRER